MNKKSIKTLLLVEDDPGDARLLREMLNEPGSPDIELTHVARMSEAEMHLAEHAVDIVLLDLGLPDAQGLGAVRRAHAAAPRIPLVVLTGLDDEDLAAQALQEGAQDYLVKGQIETRGLLRALRYAAERKIMEEALLLEREYAERQRLSEENIQSALRREIDDQLRQAQKMEAVGQLTGGIAHDFNNVLAAIVPSLELARRRTADPILLKYLDGAARAADRGAKLTHQLLAFSRKQDLLVRAVDVNRLIAEICEFLPRTLGPTVVIKADLTGSALFALTDSSQLEAALMNLAINARDAMPAGGTLTIRTGSASAGQARQAGLQDFGDYIVIAVSDTGQGMTEEVRSRAFEPYFTTKEIDKGTGLGLSMVYGLAKQSGGAGTVESAVGKGTTVFLYLPRAERPPTVADRGAEDEELDGGPASRILVVDDDDAVRDITSALLQDFGHEVIGAESGDVALELLKRDQCFQLLIVDMMMPNMHGTVFALRARALLPEVPALFVTGYADSHSVGETPNDHILRKPFRRDALAEKLRDSLGNR